MKIDSIKDPRIELARSLNSKIGRKTHDKILLFGNEQIQWAIAANLHIDFVLSKNPIILPNSIPVFSVSEGILKKVTDTNYCISVVGVASVSTQQYPDDFLVIFDNVVDFGNIGTIVRTANAFGIHSFVSTNHQLDPFQRKSIDASRGCVFNSSFKTFDSPEQTIDYLRKQDYQIIVTTPRAQFLQSQTPLQKKACALVVGNETNGICETLLNAADFAVQVPMAAPVESLNVGVFAGISLYELRFKMVLLMLKEKIFDNLGRQINVTGKMIQLAFDRIISKVSDLSGAHVIFLMILHLDKSMTQLQISKDIGLFGDDLVEFLYPLEHKKLIIPDKNEFTLSIQGQQFLAEIWPIVEKTNAEILKGFSSIEREQLESFLARLQKNCTDIT